MEADTRRLQPACIAMFSIEKGADRFTLGGARYNLYFVATTDLISVFVPDFPFQKLGTKPSLVITPTLANDNAPGFIDNTSPHAINHLIVGDLGNEEILLVARDSGNIDAYHSRAIRDAIQKEPYRFSKDGHADFVGLRAFFSHWVHRSAWGLAIHKEARMIAVSANRVYAQVGDPYAKITVFAFALSKSRDHENTDESGKDDDYSESHSEWRTWKPDSTPWNQGLPPRHQNYKIILDEGHSNNIPSISFSNTSDDPNGTWLFSTDIGGDMIAWNIWKRDIVNSWTTECKAPDARSIRLGRIVRGLTALVRGVARRIDEEADRGWIVAALDPRAFAVATSVADFCGDSPLLIDPEQRSFGITDIAASSVPGNSQRHPQHRRLHPNFELDLEIAEGSGNDAGENPMDEVLSDQEGIIAGMESRNQPARTDDSDQWSESLPPVGLEAAEAVDDEDTSGDQDVDQFSQRTGSSTSLSSLNRSLSVNIGKVAKRLVRSASQDEQEFEDHGLGAMVGELSEGSDSIEFPSFPLLHCSVSHMRLFDAPYAERAHWYCGDVLTQLVPEGHARLPPYCLERVNMIQQIPELGLVIIGSQSGRCAVCSTVRKTRGGPLGLRVDWVLPTEKQEIDGLRPTSALLGIAVGPIQGLMKESDEHNDEDTAFSDGNIHGTTTTFDTDVIMSESSQDESGASSDERHAKRLKTSGPPLISPGRYASREQRAWAKSESIEPWRGVSYSRRYRLMLTYWDWTVLTYEIAREEPNIGTDPTRKNWRNRSAASVGHYGLQAEKGLED